MYELPMPTMADLQSVVDAHWNKAWAISDASAVSRMTHESLISLTEVSQGSVHYSDGTFKELTNEQTETLVRRFCDGEKQEGTIKLAVGDAAEESLGRWRTVFPGARIRINYFLSTGPAKGLRADYDNHHVFAVQLIGEKIWSLGARVVVASPESPSFYPENEPKIETTVRTKVGDILYIPPGGWHCAETDKLSVHATVGIYPPTYAEYLRQLISKRAATDIVLRSELPLVRAGVDDEIRFDAPSLIVVRELADRVARVSWDERTRLSSELRLLHEAERTETIARLIAEIWSEAEYYGRVALYLRGSMARPSTSKFQPWDIDLVLITRQVVSDKARRSSRGKADGVELDIKYATVRDLISVERELPTRLLLRKEGILLYGRDIVCDLSSARPSSIMAAAIASRQIEACRINDKVLSKEGGDVVTTQRFAKAALRLATPLIMVQLSRLERDPLVCGWFISANYPDLRQASDYLIACIRGENDMSEIQERSRQLLDGLLPSLKEVGNNANDQ